jgi:uncharacterized protein (TIGR00255 family)
MLNSMTGFGSGEAEAGGWHYRVQIKSVNNRFLEAPLKLPQALWAREAEARALVQRAVSRGKLELSYRERKPEAASGEVSVNLGLANSYLRAMESLAQGLGLKSEIRLEQLARYPEVISAAGAVDDDTVTAERWKAFQQALALALDELQKSRQREGAALESELRGLGAEAAKQAAKIEAKAAELVPLFKERLAKRIAALAEGIALDDPRLVTEAALLTDRADIREETVRFAAHLAEFSRMLNEGGALGKKLDFLSQELLREANTMGSKSPDAGLTQLVLELKAVIEKIKEQIQNLE